MYAVMADVREISQGIGASGRRNCNDVWQGRIRGVSGQNIIVAKFIARRGDEENPGLLLRLDRIRQRLRIFNATPTVIAGYDVVALVLHLQNIVEASDCVGCLTIPAGIQELA